MIYNAFGIDVKACGKNGKAMLRKVYGERVFSVGVGIDYVPFVMIANLFHDCQTQAVAFAVLCGIVETAEKRGFVEFCMHGAVCRFHAVVCDVNVYRCIVVGIAQRVYHKVVYQNLEQCAVYGNHRRGLQDENYVG